MQSFLQWELHHDGRLDLYWEDVERISQIRNTTTGKKLILQQGKLKVRRRE